ncbi:MAG: hypothetical protein ACRDE2_16600, partial [Chitinophagaceae bacterium]
MSLLKEVYNKLVQKIAYDQIADIIKQWEGAGKPSPPPHIIKQLTISRLREKFEYNLFIETGTY